MHGTQPRRARVYDRLEGQEPQEPPRRRFAEVDTAAEALRPGALLVDSWTLFNDSACGAGHAWQQIWSALCSALPCRHAQSHVVPALIMLPPFLQAPWWRLHWTAMSCWLCSILKPPIPGR